MAITSFRTEVNYMVSNFYYIKVMLNYQHCISTVNQFDNNV